MLDLTWQVDGDGTMDMVFPSCTGGQCFIHIVHNDQMPLCALDQLSGCRLPHNLCTADDAFKFNFDEASGVSTRYLNSALVFRFPYTLMLGSR